MYGAWLAAVVLLGAFLRFWDLGGVPPGLQQDEAVYGYDAFSILKTARDHHGALLPMLGTETFGDWSTPLQTFLTVPAVAGLGLNVEAVRTVTAVLGVVAIPATCFTAHLLFRRPLAGLIAATLIAVSPFAVHLSRFAVIPSTVPAMLALTLALVLWSLQKRNGYAFVLAALFAGLTVASYHTMKVFVPLAAVAALVVFRREVFSLGPRPVIAGGVVFGLVAGPLLAFTTFGSGGARFDQTSVFREGDVTVWRVAEQYASYFSPRFWIIEGSGDRMQVPSGGIELYAVAPLLLAGVVALGVQAARPSDPWARRTALFVLAMIVLYPAPGSVTIPAPDALRASHIVVLSPLVAAAGCCAIVDTARRFGAASRPRFSLAVLSVALLAVGLAVTVDAARRYDYYFGRYAVDAGPSFHYGLEDAIRYAFAHEAEYEEIWLHPDIHSAYIYVLFYRPWPPAAAQRDLVLTRDPPSWNIVHALDKYRFDEPSFSVLDLRLVAQTFYRDGRPAYEIRDGIIDGRSILLLHRAP